MSGLVLFPVLRLPLPASRSALTVALAASCRSRAHPPSFIQGTVTTPPEGTARPASRRAGRRGLRLCRGSRPSRPPWPPPAGRESSWRSLLGHRQAVAPQAHRRRQTSARARSAGTGGQVAGVVAGVQGAVPGQERRSAPRAGGAGGAPGQVPARAWIGARLAEDRGASLGSARPRPALERYRHGVEVLHDVGLRLLEVGHVALHHDERKALWVAHAKAGGEEPAPADLPPAVVRCAEIAPAVFAGLPHDVALQAQHVPVRPGGGLNLPVDKVFGEPAPGELVLHRPAVPVGLRDQPLPAGEPAPAEGHHGKPHHVLSRAREGRVAGLAGRPELQLEGGVELRATREPQPVEDQPLERVLDRPDPRPSPLGLRHPEVPQEPSDDAVPEGVAELGAWSEEELQPRDVLLGVTHRERQAARVGQEVVDRQVRPLVRPMDGELPERLPAPELVDVLLGEELGGLELHGAHRGEGREELGRGGQGEGGGRVGPAAERALHHALRHQLTPGRPEGVVETPLGVEEGGVQLAIEIIYGVVAGRISTRVFVAGEAAAVAPALLHVFGVLAASQPEVGPGYLPHAHAGTLQGAVEEASAATAPPPAPRHVPVMAGEPGL
mmetsp:Transcript_55312/g.171948  ORF Transcript_55312/g.171948 Transcript_55312/m.171948 type:complete len:611 (-) Transcript_55312:312-2144(-)